MPSARITKTVCEASNRAIPVQIAAIQNQRGDSECVIAPLHSQNRMPEPGGSANHAAKRRIRAAKGLAAVRLSTSYLRA